MLDAPALLDWVSRAEPGQAVVYARGDSLPRSLSTLANRLADEGYVDLVQKRDRAGTMRMMQRRSTPWPAHGIAARPSSLRRRPVAVRASAETMILRMISEAVRLRLPCPTNAELADAAQLSGPISASYRLRRLVRQGKIELRDGGPGMRRIATIVATGQSTARGRL